MQKITVKLLSFINKKEGWILFAHLCACALHARTGCLWMIRNRHIVTFLFSFCPLYVFWSRAPAPSPPPAPRNVIDFIAGICSDKGAALLWATIIMTCIVRHVEAAVTLAFVGTLCVHTRWVWWADVWSFGTLVDIRASGRVFISPTSPAVAVVWANKIDTWWRRFV